MFVNIVCNHLVFLCHRCMKITFEGVYLEENMRKNIPQGRTNDPPLYSVTQLKDLNY